jgi:protein SCO1/2
VTDHPASRPAPVDRRWALVGAIALLAVGALLMALVAVALVGPPAETAAGPTPGAVEPSPDSASFAYPQVRGAPPLDLVDHDGRPFSLASLRGGPALVFFGYTHCPDVCPATIGTLNRVIGASDVPPTMVFVSVDPERDTPAALAEYLQFLPEPYVALTGSPDRIRATADAWGVTYARIDTGSASGYAMAHTADVYLVDADGMLRAHFPFGTPEEPILAALAALPPPTAGGSPAPSAAASPSPTPSATPSPSASTDATALPVDGARPVVVSTAVWAGRTPVVLSLLDGADAPIDLTGATATVTLAALDGTPAGPAVGARIVRPPGLGRDYLLADLDIPSAGRWRLDVAAATTGGPRGGSTEVTALDPGYTPAIGEPAPDVRTPTVADVTALAAITTDPQPDKRLSETSTADARASGTPYVLVLDSYRFRVSPACGRAIGMARYMADRWRDVAFIHLEPYVYSLVSGTPVLEGDLTDPVIAPLARSWGIGEGPWGAISVPWVFVVDADGIVRSKVTGVFGTEEIDVLLAAITD